VSETGDFRNRVSLTMPGSRAELKLVRNGVELTKMVTIGELDEHPQLAAQPKTLNNSFGFTVQTVTPMLAEQFNIETGTGVVVTAVQDGSLASLAGISVGTIILEVNRQPVKNVDEFKSLVNESGASGKVLMLVSKDGMSRFLVLQH